MKYYDKVGYVESKDVGNGIWDEIVTERYMYGDIIRDSRRTDLGTNLNPDYTVSAQFSLVSDAYCYEHLAYIRYVTYKGIKWEVSSVDPTGFPRILVNVGKVYNGPEVE